MHKSKFAIVLFVTGFLILGLFIFTTASYAGRGVINDLDKFYPPVELQYPVTEDIDLTGKTVLEFRWRQTSQVQTAYYEFRLYNGYQALASTLILKQNIYKYPLELPAENFQVGVVYTWSLRQVYFDGSKSDRSHSSFTIIKK